uniref:Uncharacterized protein n=1 Tax=Aegilops tauschii subsp. strangulata TaxID=200361 RepID=A0A453MY20_AEGTS
MNLINQRSAWAPHSDVQGLKLCRSELKTHSTYLQERSVCVQGSKMNLIDQIDESRIRTFRRSVRVQDV